jgi:hypothetical protein
MKWQEGLWLRFLIIDVTQKYKWHVSLSLSKAIRLHKLGFDRRAIGFNLRAKNVLRNISYYFLP